MRWSVPVVRARLALLSTLLFCLAAAAASASQPPPASAQVPEPPLAAEEPYGLGDEVMDAVVKLPLAALLGAALALRPKRRGTPTRQAAVVQTQIILAVVGAVIMLVVGASLARAFGIVGAANLIRYRSKIEDPKDAVVMLSALSVGLAAGVGLYALSILATGFLVVALWIIESSEPESRKRFELRVKAGKDTDSLRPRIEPILARFDLGFDLRTSSDEEVCYEVRVPLEAQLEEVSDALLRLDPAGHIAVDWVEKKALPK